ncbi:MAG: hypothetical protein ACR2JK_07505 [Geodermatophilaceae bacterium]
MRTVVEAAVESGEHGPPSTVADVLAAEVWARDHAHHAVRGERTNA